MRRENLEELSDTAENTFRLKEQILELVKQSPDEREKAILLLLYQIEEKIGATNKAANFLVSHLTSLSNSFEIHLKDEAEAVNRSKGFWKAAIFFLVLCQGVVGFFSVQFIESYNKLIAQSSELKESTHSISLEVDSIKQTLKDTSHR